MSTERYIFTVDYMYFCREGIVRAHNKNQNLMVLLFLFYLQSEFFQLFCIYTGRCIEHDITPTVVLRECDTVTYAIKTGHYADKAVKAECKTGMRWRTILEGIDKESELCHGTFLREAQYLKHLSLKVSVMDTK